jgi:cyclophilin family peptidyl-prolyl cis-trans isomerase
MKGFDKNFVVFGRVVEGLNYLRKVSSQQDINNLIPAIQLKITDIVPVVKGPTSRPI